jgi:hypothetical protein
MKTHKNQLNNPVVLKIVHRALNINQSSGKEVFFYFFRLQKFCFSFDLTVLNPIYDVVSAVSQYWYCRQSIPFVSIIATIVSFSYTCLNFPLVKYRKLDT